MLRTNARNIQGIEFGWLTAVEPLEERDARGNVFWLVRCRCGKELKKRSTELGRTPRREKQVPQSCGCAGTSRVYTSKYGGSGDLSGHRFGMLQTQARHRGIVFTVSLDYLWAIFDEQGGCCAYTGMFLTLRRKDVTEEVSVASLDRIDSDKGYIPGNVQWVHPTINFMKHAMPEGEFIKWCQRVSRLRGMDH